MANESLDGYKEALAIFEANTSPRARRLANLERFVDGTQYDGLPDWFDRSQPLFKRAPCIVYQAVQTAISSNVDLVLGEGRFPAITSHPGEDDSEFDDEQALDEEDSKLLDRFISECARESRFRSASRDVFASAQGCGSGVAIFGVRGGRLFVDITRARWCVAERDELDAVTKLTIQYPYLDEYQKPDGKWAVRCRLYRRVLDEQTDTVFRPAEARDDGREPTWSADPNQTFKHDFGFCPVIWHRHMRGCSAAAETDGKAIHANVLDELRAHDFALSQRHRAAIYSGDPQWTETGVDLGSSPSGTGPIVSMPTLNGGTVTGPSQPASSFKTGGSQSPQGSGRIKGAGEVWQYENENATITLHTLPGEALKALDDHARDLRIKIQEALAVVLLDPENVKFAATVSGKALATLKARQLDRCDQYREDFGDGFIKPAISMLLRVAMVVGAKGGLRTAGIKKLLPILTTFSEPEQVA